MAKATATSATFLLAQVTQHMSSMLQRLRNQNDACVARGGSATKSLGQCLANIHQHQRQY